MCYVTDKSTENNFQIKYLSIGGENLGLYRYIQNKKKTVGEGLKVLFICNIGILLVCSLTPCQRNPSNIRKIYFYLKGFTKPVR